MVRECPANLIRKFVERLATREVFCSKDLLPLADRSQIDNVLSRLSKKEIIIRLARGVYCRKDDKDPQLPSLKAIIAAKTRVFKRRLGKASRKLRQKLKAISEKVKGDARRSLVFFTTAATSSMQTIYGRIHYQRTSSRELEPDTTSSGDAIRTLMRNLFERSNLFTRSALQAIISDEFSFSKAKCQQKFKYEQN